MGLCKCFLRSVILTAIFIAVITFIPNLPPYAEISKVGSIPKTRPLVGPLAVNEKLKDVEILHKGEFLGPEAFEEYNGELYTSIHGGTIVKFVNNQIITVAKTGKPCKHYYEEKICGRPLGFKFDKNGDLYVADAYYGILRINIKTGKKEVIVSPDLKINGKPSKLFNSLALAENGDIFWSTSSTQFDLENLVYDALADPSGRLVHYNAKTKTNKVLIDNLKFANGVILSKDEDFVIVAETFYGRIHRYYLKGPKKGTSDIFVDELPGCVDNVQSDGKDGFLVPLVEAVNDEYPNSLQTILPFPLMRKFIVRLMGLTELAVATVNNYYPTEYAKQALNYIGHYRSVRIISPKLPYQMIVRLSKTGAILESFSTTDKKLRHISDAFIFKDYLYLGSPVNDYMGRIPVSKLGLEVPKVKRSVPTEEVPKPKQTTTPPKQQTTTPPPKQQAPPPTKATTPPPKQQTPPPKQQTTPPPKQQTTPPPKQQTTPPPKQQTTPPPKQQTTPPPKQQTTPPPKQQTTQAPKQKTPPPAKVTTPPPKQQTAPPSKTTTPPPPKQQTPPPKQQTPTVKEQVGKQKVKNEL